MTNLEKFIQIMNDTFDAGFTNYKCEKCKEWWQNEYGDMTKSVEADSKPIPVKRCKNSEGVEQDVKDCTVKQWFKKINEELDEFKWATLCASGLTTYAKCVDRASERQVIVDEAMDTITAITSFLEAMGIDEEKRNEAQRRVNEKNMERGRL